MWEQRPQFSLTREPMAKTRKNSSGTAMILVVSGVIALVVGLWLVGRNQEPEAPPTATPPAAENSDRDAAERTEILPAPAPAAVRSESTGTRVVDAERAKSGSRDAAIRVVVRFAAGHEPAHVDVVVARQDSGNEVTSVRLPVEGGSAASLLTVPPGVWVWVRALVDGAYGSSVLRRLIPGEEHDVELYCAAHPTRFRITGPSPDLIAMMQVEVWEDPLESQERLLRVPFGADGRATCLLDRPAHAVVRLFDGKTVPLLADGRSYFAPGGEATLTPDQQLHGFVTRHEKRPILGSLQLGARETESQQHGAFVTTKALVDATETVRCTVGPPLHSTGTAPLAIFRTAADVWPIDVERLDLLGSIMVTFGALRPEEADAVSDLIAVRLDDQRRYEITRSRGDDHDIVAPTGRYRLVWAGSDGVDRPAVDSVLVEPNAPTKITLAPRLQPQWVFEIQDAANPATRVDGAWLVWPGQRPFGTLQNGVVSGHSDATPRPGQLAQLRLRHQLHTFEARFVSVDPTGRRAVLESELARAIPVRLRITPLPGERPPTIRTAGYSIDDLFGGVARPSITQVPAEKLVVTAGKPVQGYVTQYSRGSEQVIGWFQATAQQPDVTVEADGHWATMICPPGLQTTSVLFGGEPTATARIFPEGGRAELHVPRGTTDITVSVNGAFQPFDARTTKIVLR